MKKWFDIENGADFLGVTPRELYTLIKFNEFNLRKHLVRIPNKRLISRDGLLLLINQK